MTCKTKEPHVDWEGGALPAPTLQRASQKKISVLPYLLPVYTFCFVLFCFLAVPPGLRDLSSSPTKD